MKDVRREEERNGGSVQLQVQSRKAGGGGNGEAWPPPNGGMPCGNGSCGGFSSPSMCESGGYGASNPYPQPGCPFAHQGSSFVGQHTSQDI